MRVGMIGINHKMADLFLRGKLAAVWQRTFGITSLLPFPFVSLSTCNRTELYFSTDDLSQAHTYLLSLLRSEVPQDVEQKLYSFFGADCLHHLCRVTSGLDSAILAETEIQGQVKQAYMETHALQNLPADLHFLFQKSLQVGKKVRTGFPLPGSLPDLEHAVFELGLKYQQDISSSHVLFIGASSINWKIAQYLKKKGLKHLTICNRTFAKSELFAREFQSDILPWEARNRWNEYSWAIIAIKADKPVLSKEPIPSLVMDLSIPNIYPYSSPKVLDLDTIQGYLHQRREALCQEVDQIENYVNMAANRYYTHFLKKAPLANTVA